MNRKIEILKEGALRVQSSCERILANIDNVKTRQDVNTIERNFDLIRRIADDAVDYAYRAQFEIGGLNNE